MNNNNRGNNRRRGRNNTGIPGPRPQGGSGGGGNGGGGGVQLNRIDSRARGNAPQLLEKYRKLAQDSHTNGDRVNAEYFLQFADHYFRVIADTRLRLEEQRARRDDRWQDNGDQNAPDENDDSGEFGDGSDFPTFDQPPVYTRRDREDRGDRPPQNQPQTPPEPSQAQFQPQRDRAPPSPRPVQDTRNRYDEAAVEAAPPEPTQANPFVRDRGQPRDVQPRDVQPRDDQQRDGQQRGSRGLRPRRDDRGPRRDRDEDSNEPMREDAEAANAHPADDNVISGFDPASLPPAISASRPDDGADHGDDEPAPPPRRRARRKPAGDTDEALQSAG